MSYITQQDLEDELGLELLIQLTDDTGTEELNPVPVDKAISFAVGTFNAYARTRYTLPVPVTEVVKSKCLDLATYHLKRRRAKTSEASEALRKSLYDPAIQFLKDLSGGKVALDVPAAEETAQNPSTPDRVLSGNSRATFTDEKLDSY